MQADEAEAKVREEEAILEAAKAAEREKAAQEAKEARIEAARLKKLQEKAAADARVDALRQTYVSK